jgi:hypothetical protein
MGRTPKSGQDERGWARVAQAPQRSLELEEDWEARCGRLDVAMADVNLAHDRRNEYGKATEQSYARMGQAIVRILDEGVPMAQKLAPALASSGQPFVAGRGEVEGTNRTGEPRIRPSTTRGMAHWLMPGTPVRHQQQLARRRSKRTRTPLQKAREIEDEIMGWMPHAHHAVLVA